MFMCQWPVCFYIGRWCAATHAAPARRVLVCVACFRLLSFICACVRVCMNTRTCASPRARVLLLVIFWVMRRCVVLRHAGCGVDVTSRVGRVCDGAVVVFCACVCACARACVRFLRVLLVFEPQLNGRYVPGGCACARVCVVICPMPLVAHMCGCCSGRPALDARSCWRVGHEHRRQCDRDRR